MDSIHLLDKLGITFKILKNENKKKSIPCCNNGIQEMAAKHTKCKLVQSKLDGS